MDGIVRHEACRGPFVEIVPILVRYHVSFPCGFRFVAVIMTSSLADVRTARRRPAFTCAIDGTVPVSGRRHSIIERYYGLADFE